MAHAKSSTSAPTNGVTGQPPRTAKREPSAEPAPAPKRPTEGARSPGVVPQGDNASAAASTADAEKVLRFIIDMFPSPFWVRVGNGSQIESFPFPQGTGQSKLRPVLRFFWKFSLMPRPFKPAEVAEFFSPFAAHYPHPRTELPSKN